MNGCKKLNNFTSLSVGVFDSLFVASFPAMLRSAEAKF